MNTDQEPIPATQQEPLPASPNIKDLFEALLRRPTELALHRACDDGSTLFRFGIIAACSILVFGIVLGSFAYGEQLWAAPLKLGAGLLFAGFICFPSLYIFSSLAGSGASMLRMASLLTGMLALSGLLLLGFAPAVWIFAQSTSSFGFMGFLSISSWLMALCFAFRFLKIALRETGATQSAPLLVWITIFLLVTLQLSTTLRPILGKSDRFLTPQKKFFLQHWGETSGETLKAEIPRN